MRVFIDPGHGARDPGRVTTVTDRRKPYGYEEANAAWSTALILTHILTEAGADVRMSRRQDEFLTPGARARKANSWQADLFVSIHFNGFRDPDANGFETLHYGEGSRGYRLAGDVHRALKGKVWSFYGILDRGLKSRPRLTVLNATGMPACLVEGGFMSNPRDCKMISSGIYQIDLARAIAEGIGWYS